jgi:hypothetical protein
MQQALQRSSLVPRGFVVESAYYEGDKAVVVVHASGSVGLCRVPRAERFPDAFIVAIDGE